MCRPLATSYRPTAQTEGRSAEFHASSVANLLTHRIAFHTPPATPAMPEATEQGFEFPLPGFEALFALGGLLAVAYLVLKRRRA
jgi:hypothetical protein